MWNLMINVLFCSNAFIKLFACVQFYQMKFHKMIVISNAD
jgi:hypothetical protein